MTWTDFDSQSPSGASACSDTSCSVRGYIMGNVLYDPTFVVEPSPHLVTWTIESMMEQGVNMGYAITDYFGFLVPPSTNLIEDSDFEASINTADLHANTVGQDWYESRNDMPGLLTLETADIAGNIGKKAALLNDGIPSNAYVTQEFGTVQGPGDTFSVSFDVYIDSITDNANYDRTGFIFMGYEDGGGTNGACSTSNERFVFLTFHDSTPGDGVGLEIRAREHNTPAQPWAETGTWTPVAAGAELRHMVYREGGCRRICGHL